MNSDIYIRPARLSDIPAITEIYNEAILSTTATFDTDPKTVEDRTKWFSTHDERHPMIVAVADDAVVGWASLSAWSDRTAYDGTAETSFYVAESYRNRGIGRKLKQAIIDEAIRLGYHTLLARVAEGSDISLHLNKSFGFETVGVMKQVGKKFGRLLDVHLLQKMLK